MPYDNEFSSKASHYNIIQNPDVQAFLGDCEYLTEPSEAEVAKIQARFSVPPDFDDVPLPSRVLSIDGSLYESHINDRLPSTRVGFVKIGIVLIRMDDYGALRVHNGRFVDPFRVAALQDNNQALTFPMPSSNVRWKGFNSVRDSFRAAADAFLYDHRTRFNPDDPSTSLRSTLFHLASLRPGQLGTGDPSRLKLHRCPICSFGPVELFDTDEQQTCPDCDGIVFPSDCLRLWEEVSDFQSNYGALTRFMQDVEHLMMVHYIRRLSALSLADLSDVAFFMDRPLAVFGTSAWLHLSILRYLDKVNASLAAADLPRFLIVGLQKTGQVADHVALIERFLPNNRLFAIDDEYRYTFILNGRDPSGNGFGYETYYGQDFIFKTSSGRCFVFALPYPFASKDSENFGHEKCELVRYSQLGRALKLLTYFESDLYKNAVVPVALAHRHTAISLAPGGQVLDMLTQHAFAR